MTGWDFLDRLVSSLSPILGIIAGLVILVVLIIGFSRHGMDFIKHGFKQTSLDESLEKRFDELGKSLGQQLNGLRTEIHTELNGLHTELGMIKDNHFGHLKSYLEILDGILLDKNIISNKEKALLDNELKGM
jgi:hypothetical protein